MDLSSFFQVGPPPADAMNGYYNWELVTLSYLIAVLASFVALDITERIRTDEATDSSKLWWLLGGAIAMGMGIWTMHFIGMLAFIMPMPMSYDLAITLASLAIAIIASAFAFFLTKNARVRPFSLMAGGVLLGMGIAAMHYTGMAAMMGMTIRYLPSIFLLSLAIAVAASEAALWLMIRSCQTSKECRSAMKIGSALIMGLGICGMHYMGIEAAVFIPLPGAPHDANTHNLDPSALSLFIGTMTIVIISLALYASKSWTSALQVRNQKLLAAEAVLEKQSRELEEANRNLQKMIARSLANEGRIRAILSAAADGILVTNEKGDVELANQAAEIILGYKNDEVLTKNAFQLLAVAEEKNGLRDPPEISGLFEAGKEALFERSVTRKDGKSIPLELSLSRSNINGQTLYIILMRDITERKQAEEHLNVLNKKLVSTARMAGMTEVASCMLHNVGNVLNSINVSTQLLLKRRDVISPRVEEFALAAKAVADHRASQDLETFLKTDQIGKILPDYLQEFAKFWENENNYTQKELEALNNQVHHIKSIVMMQQSLCGNKDLIETIKINDLVEDALSINSEAIGKNKIVVHKEYGKIAPLEGDKVKIMQVLVNLLKNAAEALEETSQTDKMLTIRTYDKDKESIVIEITDNGNGIAPDNLTKIFSYGFTTKKNGHGFGLHSSALSTQQMGGALTASSKGPGLGAVFMFTVPKRIKIKENGKAAGAKEAALL